MNSLDSRQCLANTHKRGNGPCMQCSVMHDREKSTLAENFES